MLFFLVWVFDVFVGSKMCLKTRIATIAHGCFGVNLDKTAHNSQK